MPRIMENPYSHELKKLMEALAVDDLMELASALSVPENTVRTWHKRGAVPLAWIERVSERSGRPFEWFKNNGIEKNLSEEVNKLTKLKSPENLTAGHLQVKEINSPANLPPHHADAKYPAFKPQDWSVRDGAADKPWGLVEAGDSFPVPLFEDIRASAGNGHGAPDASAAAVPEVHVTFSASYMRRHFGRAGSGFAMIYVRGDSMQPGLIDGDEIVIDTRVRQVDRDGVYAISLRGDLKVKRIQQRLDGSLVVKSDNPAYEAEIVGAQQAEQFAVEGRLVWPRLR